MRRHDDTQNKRPAEVTNADLSKAIARRRVPFLRVGNEYVVRQADVRKLSSPREDRPETAPKRDTLEMGRSA
jgi:hypothetical protein